MLAVLVVLALGLAGPVSGGGRPAAAVPVPAQPAGTIDRVVGRGHTAVPAGLTAGQSSFQTLGALTRDNAGRVLFIADDRVLRIELDGSLTVVAGGGSNYLADGVPATEASIRPVDVAVTSSGEVLIAEAAPAFFHPYYGMVRMVDGTGTIHLVAGGSFDQWTYWTFGWPGQLWAITGIAAGSGGDVVVSQSTNRVTGLWGAPFAGTGTAGFGGDGGPAVDALLDDPRGVAMGADAVFIADRANNRIRRVDRATGIISTVAGTGVAGFGGDGGPATAATLDRPVDVWADGDVLYVVDGDGTRIRRIGPAGTITTFAGGGTRTVDGIPPIEARLELVAGLVVAGGAAYVSDAADRRLRRVLPLGPITTAAGLGAGAPADTVALIDPRASALGPDGSLYVVEYGRNRVVRVDPAGVVSTVAGSGSVVPAYSGDGGPASAAELARPEAVAVAADGDVFIGDAGNNRVRRVDSATGTITTAMEGVKGSGLVVAPDGSLYASTTGKVVRLGPSGSGLTNVAGTGAEGFGGDGGPATAARIRPAGLGLDAAGGLVIADTSNNRLRRVDPAAGTIETLAGDGTAATTGDGGSAAFAQVKAAKYLTSGPAGDIVFLDDARYVRRIDPTGTVRTIAGNGYASTTDGLPATETGMRSPTGLAVDADGDVFIDMEYDDVVRVVAGPLPVLPAASGLHPVEPVRVVDSREVGSAPWDGSPIGAGESRAVTVAGVGAIAPDATAVVANVTVTGGTAASYVTVHPAGSAPPTAANVLFGPGDTVPNLVTVAVGDGGAVAVFNQLGSVHVTVDVVGYYREGSGAGFSGFTPRRVLDSRGATGGWASTPLGAGEERSLVLADTNGIPAGATAVAMNVTVTGGTEASYLSVRPAGTADPGTANLLFGPGQTVPNLVVVGLGDAGGDPGDVGAVTFFNQLGEVDVVADVVGYFEVGTGGRFHPVDPERILDSRVGVGLSGPWGTNDNRTWDPTGGGSGTVPGSASALALNVTATGGTANTYVAASSTPGVVPALTANLLVGAGQTVPNAVYVGTGTGPGVDLYNQAGRLDLVADLAGWFG